MRRRPVEDLPKQLHVIAYRCMAKGGEGMVMHVLHGSRCVETGAHILNIYGYFDILRGYGGLWRRLLVLE